MEDEQLYFQTCEELDTYFREGREFFNETYVKKLAQVSTYFSRVQEAVWPLNSGTSQKAFRFGRGFYDPTKPWRDIISERCAADSCDIAPEKIRRPGSESYNFELMRKDMMTDWICVEDLMYRLVPVEEIMQFEASNAIITRSVHEEFARSQYIGHAAHKWIGVVNNDNEYCAPFDDESWIMREYEGTGEAGFDTRYIYVKLPADQLNTISTLALDMLDDILIDLGDEDEAFRVDLRDIGIMKLDMIVPDARVARKLFVQAKESNGFWNTDAEFDKSLSDLRLGIPRTIGDYTFAYDNNAYRYNVDSAYNDPTTGGPDGTGLPTFDENDDTTWPRLVRVLRYKEQAAGELGYEYIPNSDYRKADFAISLPWINNALLKWRNPNWTGTGEVQMVSQNYAGDFTWRRPDWECNRRQKSGFFDAEFRVAMQVKDPKLMHAILHRVDHSRNLTGAACDLQTYTPPDPIDVYVCQGVTP